jgi:hypothetical protein
MNLIKPKNISKHVRKVFMKEVVPVSNLSKKREQVFFPLRPDNQLSTYYREREQTAMTLGDFEVPGCESSEKLEKALAELWGSQGYAELVPLAQTTARLAEMLRESEDESQEVSPFIYVMF